MRLDGSDSIFRETIAQMKLLYGLFRQSDALQIEVNPLGLTPQGQVLAFDAKLSFDDNASFRQPTIYGNQAEAGASSSSSSSSAREQVAASHNLNYIALDGSIGFLVNGAGLAMATMDLLALHGGRPANFLDVGGGAQPAQIAAAFGLLCDDPQVHAILVNIFGGIVRCDLIAEGILQAVKERNNMRIPPLVIRLAGTNEAQGRERLLTSYPGSVQIISDLEDAARQAVSQSTLHSERRLKA